MVGAAPQPSRQILCSERQALRPAAAADPLLTAANGKKSMRLAGRHGDGLVTDPLTRQRFKPEWEAGAAEAGRNIADMPVLIEQFVVVGDKNDAEKAAALWRFLPKAFKSYYNVPDPVAIEQRPDAELPLDKVFADLPIRIDPGIHIAALQKLFDGGATIVNVHSGQADQHKVIDFYGRLRKRRPASRTRNKAFWCAAIERNLQRRQSPESAKAPTCRVPSHHLRER